MLLTNTTTTGGDTGAHIAMPKYLESLSATATSPVGPGLVRRLPSLHLLLHHPRPLHRHRRVDHPVRRGVQVGHDPRFGHAADLRLGVRPVLPPPPPTSDPAGGGHPSVLVRLHLHHLRREPVLDLGGGVRLLLQPVVGGPVPRSLRLRHSGGKYRGWTAIVLAGCVLSHIVPGMYALGGAVILTIVELLPSRWGIADSSLHVWRSDRTAAPVPWTRTLWWAGSTVGIGLLLTGWWLVPFGLEHAYSSSMGYTNVEGWAQYFREADAWALVLAGIRPDHGRGDAEPLRHHRHGAGHRVGGGHRRRPAGRPLQRPPPAPVVPLRLLHGRLGLRHRGA